MIMRYLNRGRLIVLLNSIFILLIYTGVFSFVWEEIYNQMVPVLGFFFFRLGNIGFAFIYAIMLFVFLELFNGLNISDIKISDMIYSQILAITCTDIMAYLIICLLVRAILSPLYLLASIPVILVFSIAWNNFICRRFNRLVPPRRTIMVYGSRAASTLTEKMSVRDDKFIICEAIKCQEGIEKILERISRFQAVVVCDTSNEIRNDIIKFCFKKQIVAYIMPKISDVLLSGAVNIHTFDTPLLLCKNFGLKMEFRLLKRTLDLFISAVGLILISPVLLICAAAIKLNDKGAVFYRQQRLTLDGRVFWLYKFRSMKENAESDGVARLSEKGDSRITTVGGFLRKTRLDELPQLINIFIGDMSFVGPRPERPEIAEQYEEIMPEFSYRLAVKAGLTGYAQVMGKYNTTPYDKLKMDLMYIQKYSLLMDIKLMIKTLKIIFLPESTEGIDVGMITADMRETGKEAETKSKEESLLMVSGKK